MAGSVGGAGRPVKTEARQDGTGTPSAGLFRVSSAAPSCARPGTSRDISGKSPHLGRHRAALPRRRPLVVRWTFHRKPPRWVPATTGNGATSPVTVHEIPGNARCQSFVCSRDACKKGFFDSVIPALGLSVFCHQGLVVLAGVADRQIGDKAVAVPRAVEGVVTVKSFLQLKAR